MQVQKMKFRNIWNIGVLMYIEQFTTNDFRILLYLYSKGEANISEIRLALSMSYSTVYKILYKLQYYRLVKHRGGERTEVLFSLTDYGVQIVQKLIEIDKIIEKIAKEFKLE